MTDRALVLDEAVLDALEGTGPGDEVIVITWLDRGDRSVLRVHPRLKPVLTGEVSER